MRGRPVMLQCAATALPNLDEYDSVKKVQKVSPAKRTEVIKATYPIRRTGKLVRDLMETSVTRDKQLKSVNVQAVKSKQKLDQALNVKEFAVLAGLSYSVAREWFQLPGFPVIQGKIFWQDFLFWRRTRHSVGSTTATTQRAESATIVGQTGNQPQWPPRAARILSGAK